MADPRFTLTPAKQELKAKSKALVRAAGGVECGIGRVGKNKLSEYGRSDNEIFMPIDVIADLEECTHGTVGHPIVTRHLASLRGFAMYEIPTVVPNGSDLHAAIAQHSRCANDVTAELISDLADGRIDPEEAVRGRAKCDAAIECLVALRTHLNCLAEDM